MTSDTFASAEHVFQIMKQAIEANGTTLIPKVKGIIKFDVKNVGSWTLLLKSPPATIEKDSTAKPALTITVGEADLLKLAANKLNAQQAFMQGKLKIKGNMGLAMKLNAVMDATRKQLSSGGSGSAGSATSSSASKNSSAPSEASNLKSAVVFEQIEKGLQARGAEFVKKTKGTYQFLIKPDGEWFLDLKNGNGKLVKGKQKADLTITISDDDFMLLASGKLTGQQAFMKGKLKLRGNMGLAMKLGSVFDAAKPKSKL